MPRRAGVVLVLSGLMCCAGCGDAGSPTGGTIDHDRLIGELTRPGRVLVIRGGDDGRAWEGRDLGGSLRFANRGRYASPDGRGVTQQVTRVTGEDAGRPVGVIARYHAATRTWRRSPISRGRDWESLSSMVLVLQVVTNVDVPVDLVDGRHVAVVDRVDGHGGLRLSYGSGPDPFPIEVRYDVPVAVPDAPRETRYRTEVITVELCSCDRRIFFPAGS